MADTLSETTTPETTFPAPDALNTEIARKNMQWGWALLGLFLLLFGGTVGVAFVYLWLS